jgi:hypothetical protein
MSLRRSPGAAVAAAAVALLLAGIFRAQIGAIGKQPQPATP